MTNRAQRGTGAPLAESDNQDVGQKDRANDENETMEGVATYISRIAFHARNIDGKTFAIAVSVSERFRHPTLWGRRSRG